MFIRDAEIENTIRDFASPVFEAAGVDPAAVRIHLVKDKSLNAFVANGLNLFLHTGLLTRSENAGQVIGVIAHETGHIAGGHLVRIDGAMTTAGIESIVALALGGAAAVATGRGDLGAAITAGGAETARRSLFAFSRTQEASADQAALRFLDETHQSAGGLLQFFEILGDQELLSESRQDPYVRTHPLTRDRVEAVRTFVGRSPWSKTAPRPEAEEEHKRMKAKLIGFFEPLYTTLARYKETDDSLESRYARAIAWYRKPDLGKALPLIDGLIAQRPNDPYFLELKGQILFENGRIAEALDPYRKSVKLLPTSGLLRTSLAQVETELEDPTLLADAQSNLDEATRLEPDSSLAWRLMAVAYGRAGNEGMASVAQAKFAILSGHLKEADYHVGRAEKLLPKGSRFAVRLQDVKDELQQAKDEKARR